VVIYLDVPVADTVKHNRAIGRGRKVGDGPDDISTDYVQLVHRAYDDFIEEVAGKAAGQLIIKVSSASTKVSAADLADAISAQYQSATAKPGVDALNCLQCDQCDGTYTVDQHGHKWCMHNRPMFLELRAAPGKNSPLPPLPPPTSPTAVGALASLTLSPPVSPPAAGIRGGASPTMLVI
jgi:hypothetical protein